MEQTLLNRFHRTIIDWGVRVKLVSMHVFALLLVAYIDDLHPPQSYLYLL